jgi:hypothetical protein
MIATDFEQKEDTSSMSGKLKEAWISEVERKELDNRAQIPELLEAKTKLEDQAIKAIVDLIPNICLHFAIGVPKPVKGNRADDGSVGCLIVFNGSSECRGLTPVRDWVIISELMNNAVDKVLA